MKELAVILTDIRSAHNVGSILRSADCFGVNHVFFCGITPYPLMDNDIRLPHLSKKLTNAIHKTALGAEKSISFSVHKDSHQAIKDARKLGYEIAAIEQSKNSIPLVDYSAPTKLAIILGNEVNGLSMQTLGACDVILEIPMLGTKESLNVSVAGAIAIYSLRLKDVR